MATVNANRPCGIAFDDGTRVELRVGLNEDVPDAVKKHPYFKALVAEGDVQVVAVEEADDVEEQKDEKPGRRRGKKGEDKEEQPVEVVPAASEQDAE